jgi:hypothetical protein
MSISTLTETNWNSLPLPVAASANADRTGRIQAALGLATDGLPRIDEDALARYYAYLSARMSFPFTAYYPQPMNAQERNQFRCTVLELLDPSQHLGDEIDGIYCRIRKGNFVVDLPLIDLPDPHDSPDVQLIEDYCYWFGNWR